MTKPALPQPPAQPHLRVPTVGDLVEMVPYLVGFHPRDSLVVVGMRGQHSVVRSILRSDLDDVRRTPAFAVPIARHLADDRSRAAVAFVYGGRDVDGELPERPAVDRLRADLTRHEIVLADVLYVGATRWWSYHCARERCCPPHGTPLASFEGRTSPVVAAATYAGLVALPDRAALEQTLRPVDAEQRLRLEPALARAKTAVTEAVRRDGTVVPWRDGALRALREAVEEQAHDRSRWLDDDRAGTLLVALTDDVTRDGCCEWTTDDVVLGALELWRQLARRAPAPYDVAPLTLVGWTAWITGQGALARIAVRQALDSDADCRLALLLEEALDLGIRPAALPGGSQRHRRRGRGAAAAGEGGEGGR